MKFIHIADIHLGMKPDYGCPWSREREAELWMSFERVLQVCNEQKIDLLLIAGDLFHRPPVLSELDRVRDLFLGLTGTQVVMISGEHDYVKPGGCYDTYEWPAFVSFLKSAEMESVYLEELDVTVHGCSYREPVQEEALCDGVRPDEEGEIQILMVHGGKLPYLPIDEKQLREAAFDYVALGHEHQPHLNIPERICYPGSLEPLEPERTEKHGYILGELTQEATFLQFVSFAYRSYTTLRIRISDEVTQEELEDGILKTIENGKPQTIYRILLEGRYRPGHPMDTDALLALGTIEQVEDKTYPNYDFQKLLDRHKDDMIGMYLEEFKKIPAGETQQRAMYLGLEALLAQEEKT